MHTTDGADSRVVFMGQGVLLGTLSNTAEDDPIIGPPPNERVNAKIAGPL